jgi:hypothetical protein
MSRLWIVPIAVILLGGNARRLTATRSVWRLAQAEGRKTGFFHAERVKGAGG